MKLKNMLLPVMAAMMLATAPAYAQNPLTRPGAARPQQPAKPQQPARPQQPAKPQQPAQSSRVQQLMNPSRNVLYTLPQGEELYMNEYFSNAKIGDNKFACMTYNNRTKNLTFVLNGSSVISAKDLEVGWIDLQSKDKCIYKYMIGDKTYLVIDGEKLGPYEEVEYWITSVPTWSDGSTNYDLVYNRKQFHFKRMGTIFRHDNNGSIYNCGESWDIDDEKDPAFKSYNGLHKAQFTNGLRSVNIDGKTYNLITDASATNIRLGSTPCVGNDGVCIIWISYSIPNDGWHSRTVLIKNGSMTDLSSDQFYDPNTKSIRNCYDAGYIEMQFEDRNVWVDDKILPNINVTLQDKDEKHLFIAKWDYDYVMIDDNRYGKAAPLQAYYDEAANAFCWVALEGRQIVQYVYKL